MGVKEDLNIAEVESALTELSVFAQVAAVDELMEAGYKLSRFSERFLTGMITSASEKPYWSLENKLAYLTVALQLGQGTVQEIGDAYAYELRFEDHRVDQQELEAHIDRFTPEPFINAFEKSDSAQTRFPVALGALRYYQRTEQDPSPHLDFILPTMISLDRHELAGNILEMSKDMQSARAHYEEGLVRQVFSAVNDGDMRRVQESAARGGYTHARALHDLRKLGATGYMTRSEGPVEHTPQDYDRYVEIQKQRGTTGLYELGATLDALGYEDLAQAAYQEVLAGDNKRPPLPRSILEAKALEKTGKLTQAAFAYEHFGEYLKAAELFNQSDLIQKRNQCYQAEIAELSHADPLVEQLLLKLGRRTQALVHTIGKNRDGDKPLSESLAELGLDTPQDQELIVQYGYERRFTNGSNAIGYLIHIRRKIDAVHIQESEGVYSFRYAEQIARERNMRSYASLLQKARELIED